MAALGTQTPERECVRILGVPVDCVTVDQTLDRIQEFIEAGGPHLIVTADATAIVIAQSNEKFRDLIESADLVTPDGNGILWAAKRKGVLIPERVSGVDIVGHLCSLSSKIGFRIYLLGAAPGVAELASTQLQQKYPGCQIVGTHDGFFAPSSDADIASEVALSNPDVLLVAMGMPRQEQFIRATEAIIKSKVAMGIGGSLDVFSGRTKRAPSLVQRAKLEWLWRLILNPRKISKVKMLPIFYFMVRRENK